MHDAAMIPSLLIKYALPMTNFRHYTSLLHTLKIIFIFGGMLRSHLTPPLIVMNSLYF